MALCLKHGDNHIQMIDIFIQWNNSPYSNLKRYCAIGKVCPQCNDVFFFDRNDFGGKIIK